MKTRLIPGSLAPLLIAPLLLAASLEKQAQKLDDASHVDSLSRGTGVRAALPS